MEVVFLNTIDSLLKHYREKNGKTQKQVADEINVSRSYYADVERERYRPSLRLLSKLAELFNIDLNFLKKIEL